ncbi:MAG: MaoC family dehydratase [Pseudomonadota bacterium]
MLSAVALREHLGTEIGVSRWFMIDQDRINAFADVTDDHQFIHLDPERAADETAFDGTVAHGFLTVSLLSAMAYDALPPIEGARVGVNYGFNRLRFVSPVPAGAQVRGRFTLHALSDEPPTEVTLTWAVSVEIENHVKPALVAEWINRLYFEELT